MQPSPLLKNIYGLYNMLLMILKLFTIPIKSTLRQGLTLLSLIHILQISKRLPNKVLIESKRLKHANLLLNLLQKLEMISGQQTSKKVVSNLLLLHQLAPMLAREFSMVRNFMVATSSQNKNTWTGIVG